VALREQATTKMTEIKHHNTLIQWSPPDDECGKAPLPDGSLVYVNVVLSSSLPEWSVYVDNDLIHLGLETKEHGKKFAQAYINKMWHVRSYYQHRS
jgi:hypothetical protein